MRRSHHRIKSVNIIEDKKTGEYKLSHHVDLNPDTTTVKNFRYLNKLMKKITIAIDAMGGDDAPKKNLEGLKISRKNQNSNDYFFNLYGERNLKK